MNVPPAEWPMRIGGLSSPPTIVSRCSTTPGTVSASIGDGIRVESLDLDLEPRIGGRDHAVALALVVRDPVLPAPGGDPEAVNQDDGVGGACFRAHCIPSIRGATRATLAR